MNLEEQYKSMFEDSFHEFGKELAGDARELARYASERAAHLATLVGQPGFDEAVRAERDSVALRAGIAATTAADAADQRLLGMIHGALRIGAAALV